jgi:hypothetical protein
MVPAEPPPAFGRPGRHKVGPYIGGARREGLEFAGGSVYEGAEFD